MRPTERDWMITPRGCFTSHCCSRSAVAIPGAHRTFTNYSQCVLRFTMEENGCERGGGNRNTRFPVGPPNYIFAAARTQGTVLGWRLGVQRRESAAHTLIYDQARRPVGDAVHAVW
jgi:hypothetical protein